MAEPLGPTFVLPYVDDPAETEVGVILLGLDAARLLAGLGMAALTDDATAVALSVDHLHHAAPPGWTFEALLAAGTARWSRATTALAGVDPVAATTPRQAWARARRDVESVVADAAGPACRSYLAACWVRRSEIDRWVAEPR